MMRPEVVEALKRFRDANGRCWKSKLRALWESGKDADEPDGTWLRYARNTLGPSGLISLDLGR